MPITATRHIAPLLVAGLVAASCGSETPTPGALPEAATLEAAALDPDTASPDPADATPDAEVTSDDAATPGVPDDTRTPETDDAPSGGGSSAGADTSSPGSSATGSPSSNSSTGGSSPSADPSSGDQPTSDVVTSDPDGSTSPPSEDPTGSPSDDAPGEPSSESPADPPPPGPSDDSDDAPSDDPVAEQPAADEPATDEPPVAEQPVEPVVSAACLNHPYRSATDEDCSSADYRTPHADRLLPMLENLYGSSSKARAVNDCLRAGGLPYYNQDAPGGSKTACSTNGASNLQPLGATDQRGTLLPFPDYDPTVGSADTPIECAWASTRLIIEAAASLSQGNPTIDPGVISKFYPPYTNCR